MVPRNRLHNCTRAMSRRERPLIAGETIRLSGHLQPPHVPHLHRRRWRISADEINGTREQWPHLSKDLLSSAWLGAIEKSSTARQSGPIDTALLASRIQREQQPVKEQREQWLLDIQPIGPWHTCSGYADIRAKLLHETKIIIRRRHSHCPRISSTSPRLAPPSAMSPASHVEESMPLTSDHNSAI